jgi:hypothetical protein
MASALGVRDALLVRASEPSNLDNGFVGRFDRDNIVMPAVIIDSPLADRSVAARELIELVWQSAGWPENPHKNEDD